MTSDELIFFESLAKVIVRFSPFDDGSYPGVYRNEEDVKKAINHVISKQIRD